jgi:flagellar protein FlaG
MNIQPVGVPVHPKTEDRPVQAAGQAAATDKTSSSGEGAAPAPTREQVEHAVKQINQSMRANDQALEFSIDEDSKETVVKIIDQKTKEVVRQIPSPEALDIAKSLDKMMGLLISQKA